MPYGRKEAVVVDIYEQLVDDDEKTIMKSFQSFYGGYAK